MRVMVMVKATEDSEEGIMPPPKLFEDMGKFNEELVQAGIMMEGAGLKPSKLGKRVAFDGASRTVIDGPFAETRELVAGYWIWEVKDMAEAVEWVKRCPNPMMGRAKSKSAHSTKWRILPKSHARKGRQATTGLRKASPNSRVPRPDR